MPNSADLRDDHKSGASLLNLMESNAEMATVPTSADLSCHSFPRAHLRAREKPPQVVPVGTVGTGKMKGTGKRHPLAGLAVGESYWADIPQSALVMVGRFRRENPGWNYRTKPETRDFIPGLRITRVS